MSTACECPALVPGGLAIPVSLATALMQYATNDPTHPHISGLGMDAGMLCATDGLTGIRVHGLATGDTPALQDTHDHAWWPGAVVKEAISVARALAVVRASKPTLFLAWSECGTTDMHYPPLDRIFTHELSVKRTPTGIVGLDGTLLARLQKVCEAVQGRRHKDARAHTVRLDVAGPNDPVFAFVQGATIAVEVVIMPVRL